MSDRTEYIAGLRAFADWLESNPDVREPQEQRLLLSLSTNPAVEAFAAEHGLDVTIDDDGNASCELTFGSITYHAYGYRDFAEHCAATDEKRARAWAEKNGVALVKAGEGA
jgi:hypothetical protein